MMPTFAVVPKPRIVLGQPGGLAGGKARADKLSPERRSEIARLGQAARQAKDKELTPS